MKIAIMSFAHLHAMSYAAILAGHDGVEVRASDPDHGERPGESGGPELAARMGIGYLPSYEDLLDWGPDAVLVCAENVRHRALVEQAAAASAHVLCEKPLATSVVDAEAMAAACDAAGVGLMVAHPVRFSPAFAALRAALGRGELGELVAITGTNNGRLPTDQRRWFVDPALAGGGAIIDHTVHVLDLLDALTDGESITDVYASANRMLHSELDVETAALVSARTARGVPIAIDCSWSRPATSPTWGGLTLQLVGTRGIADFDAFAGRVAGDSARSGALWLPYGADLDAAMIGDFLAAVASGEPVQPDGASGLRTVRVVEAAYASLRSGQVEPVSTRVSTRTSTAQGDR